jgi:hypothetical protein
LSSQLKTTSYADCRKTAGAPLGTGVAYHLQPGVLVCASYLDGGPWDDVLIGLDVIFSSRAPEKQALVVARRLMPPDGHLVNRRMGHNPDWANRGGSCASVLYSSDTVESVLEDVAPSDWAQTPR